MEIVTKIPGLQQIAEKFFEHLSKDDLLNCRLVSSSFKEVLNKPIFWFSKHEASNEPELKTKRSLNSIMKIYKCWKFLAGKLKNGRCKEEFVLVMIRMYKRKRIEAIHPLEIAADLAKPKKYDNFVKFVLENVDINCAVNFVEELKTNTLVFKTKYENFSLIHLAAYIGFNDIFEKLLKKYESPNIPKNVINLAASNGHLEIVKLLADKNTVNFASAICFAAYNGHLEIVKFLVNFTDTPNAEFEIDGFTPIHFAAANGYLEMVKFLAGLTKTPNVPDSKYGYTPIYYAKYSKHSEIVKFLEKCTNQQGPQKVPNGYYMENWTIIVVIMFIIFIFLFYTLAL